MTRKGGSRLDAHVALNRMGAATNPKKVMVEEGMTAVTATWLAQVFGMKLVDVKRRLSDCPTATAGTTTQHGMTRGRTYLLKEAAAYLVPPKVSPADFLRAIKKGGMPSTMQQAFWDAMLKQQKWMENAGQLWHTDKIRDVLGGTFQTLKFTMQLWEDSIETEIGLTEPQRDKIRVLVDGLQQELYDSLLKQMQEKQTGPQLDDLPALMAASGGGGFVADQKTGAVELDEEAESLL